MITTYHLQIVNSSRPGSLPRTLGSSTPFPAISVGDIINGRGPDLDDLEPGPHNQVVSVQHDFEAQHSHDLLMIHTSVTTKKI